MGASRPTTDRPVHMVRATACGRARRGDGFTSDWSVVRCPDCEVHRPVRRSRCSYCFGVIAGACLSLGRFGLWLHHDCADPFKASPLGRYLFLAFPDLFYPTKCSHCGRPGPDHGPACKAAR
jgi:hypothetical protein